MMPRDLQIWLMEQELEELKRKEKERKEREMMQRLLGVDCVF